MIKVNSLHKKYKSGKEEFEALRGIDLVIEEGKTIAIVGKSGSGKSTLMHVLAGLDVPTSGEVLYDDKSLGKFSQTELADFRNKKIGFVFQQFFLQPNLTVLENVQLPLRISGAPQSEMDEKAMKALEAVDLSDKAKNKATDLSGGQKQRVCIARAIVNNPKIIFADEPTGNLDSENGAKIIELLFNLNKEMGITLVFVTHDEDLANMCDKRIFIKDGEVIKEEVKN